MKINSDRAEFYDYLRNIYSDGNDYLEPIFNRKFSYGWQICKGSIEIDEDQYFIKQLDGGWNESEIIVLPPSQRSKFGKYFIGFSLLEVGRTKFLFMEPYNLETLEVEDFQLLKRYDGGEKLDEAAMSWICLDKGEFIDKDDKIISGPIDYPEQILQYQLPDQENLKHLKGLQWYNHIYEYPFFSKTNIPKILKPEDIYFPLEQYLREIQFPDKIPEDNRNDIQKLESKGFDKKISFRKRKL